MTDKSNLKFPEFRDEPILDAGQSILALPLMSDQNSAAGESCVEAAATSIIPSELRQVIRLTLQIFFFWVMNEVGHFLSTALRIPLPGNLIGMSLLLLMLVVGVIKLEWIEIGGSLLTRHMALFFIPITVGLMGFGDLFLAHGLSILTTLFLSAAVGIAAAGISVQFAQNKQKQKKEILENQTDSEKDIVVQEKNMESVEQNLPIQE